MTDGTVVELEVPVVAKAEKAECDSYCCVGGRKESPEDRAARKERKRRGYEKAMELLIEAAAAARDDDPEKAKALVKVAEAWDAISY